MRIGNYDLQQIRTKIVGDVYDTLELELKKRKTRIAQQNRDLWLKPFLHLLDQLPKEMVTRCKEYNVRIKYMPTNLDLLEEESKRGIDEKWEYKSDTPIVNPLGDNQSYGYSNAAENELHPELQTIADKLCDDILRIRKEKTELQRYLYETTQNQSGSKQLRETWPSHLHKYLPAEPIKIGKKAKPIIKNPDVPTFLKDRLTTNLLEDNNV